MDVLAQRFEDSRPHLAAVAYRMLGSRAEADDAVQEAWLRLARTDVDGVDNLRGWLTTVVSRVCLDMLRSRTSRREDPLADDERVAPEAGPEGEAVLADSVGAALLVVLDTLTPAERLAFVLHDLFAMPFDEIGRILGRSTAAAKQIASRARRHVRGSPEPTHAGRTRRQRQVVEAFMKAVRAGDVEALLAVLDPDAVVRIDAAARFDGVVRRDAPEAEAGQARELRGASTWATTFIALSRGLEQFAQPVLIDGSVGLILAPRGHLVRALIFTFDDDKVTRLEAIGDPARLRDLDIAVL